MHHQIPATDDPRRAAIDDARTDHEIAHAAVAIAAGAAEPRRNHAADGGAVAGHRRIPRQVLAVAREGVCQVPHGGAREHGHHALRRVVGRDASKGAQVEHAGEHDQGTALAAAHAASFPADVDAVIATAAGCGSSMKDTHTSGAPVLDVCEYLDRLGLVTPLALSAPLRAAYQDACHLAHAQQITACLLYTSPSPRD